MATFRAKHSPFWVSGPEVEFETNKVYCCREWEIVIATTTWSPHDEAWKREHWWLRNCGICGEIPQRRNA